MLMQTMAETMLHMHRILEPVACAGIVLSLYGPTEFGQGFESLRFIISFASLF
jgi:hypothetical protein